MSTHSFSLPAPAGPIGYTAAVTGLTACRFSGEVSPFRRNKVLLVNPLYSPTHPAKSANTMCQYKGSVSFFRQNKTLLSKPSKPTKTEQKVEPLVVKCTAAVISSRRIKIISKMKKTLSLEPATLFATFSAAQATRVADTTAPSSSSAISAQTTTTVATSSVRSVSISVTKAETDDVANERTRDRALAEALQCTVARTTTSISVTRSETDDYDCTQELTLEQSLQQMGLTN